MKKTYRYFFYDFDGMIADTYPHLARAFATALSEARQTEIDEGKVFDLLKVSFNTAYEFYHVSNAEKALIKAYHEDMQFEPIPTLFPHMEEVLRESLRLGCQNFIYTNRGKTLYQYLDAFGVRDCFTDFILHANKPDPTKLLNMIGQHDLDRSLCVVVGDRSIDVDAAYAAKVDGILFDPDSRVKEHHATHVIQGVEELFSFLP